MWKINIVVLSSLLMSMELTDNFTADKNSELKMREKSSDRCTQTNSRA